MRGEDRALADVASSVADGAQVDWDAADVQVPAGDRRLIRHLRLVENISRFYRTLPDEDATVPEGRYETPSVDRWGPLVLLERIGQGTTGEVYRAWDSQLHRDVALKLLHQVHRTRGDARERVLEEARRLARIRHEHVVSVYGAEEHEGRVGLWMELVRGESLEQRVRAKGPLSAAEAAQIGEQLCAALSAVHAAGLVHRDVKAQNVILEISGRTVLMDFGTGEELRQSAGSNRLVGTPLYLAPEIFTGEPATVQSDIYSVGVLLFYLVTGEFPVKASSMQELARAHSQEKRRLRDVRPNLPEAFEASVERALQRDPARRFRTTDEFALQLRPSQAVSLAAPTGELPSAGRPRWWLAAAATVLLALTVALIVWTRRAPMPSIDAVREIAVAPMTTSDASALPPLLAEGLTGELKATLGQIRSLRVKSAAAAGETGDADAVLQTTVLTAGIGDRSKQRIRVTAKLIDPRNDSVIWSGTFEEAVGATFALQAAIAREIASAVGVAITPDELAGLQRSRQTTPEAETAFLEGRAYVEGYGVGYSRRALDAFRRAIDADPGHAGAHAGAARAIFTLGFRSEISQPVARVQALAEAQRAIELDETLPEGHATLADVYFYYDWNWRAAEAGYLRSLELNRSYAYGRTQYAQLLAATGRTGEAIAQSQLAVDLQPSLPDALRVHGLILYYHRDFASAAAAVRRSLELDRNAPGSWVILGRIAEAEGRLDEARTHTERAIELSDEAPPALRVQLMRLQALAGRQRLAQAGLQQLRRESDARGVLWNPQFDAYVALGHGDHERAIAFLEEAAQLREPTLLWLGVDPRMDPIREHPRFAEILRTLGLN